MNYIGMITGHKCCGSGYTEILLEAGLVNSGCMKGVLSGKAYGKALFNLKIVCEAMERLLIEQFIEDEEIQIDSNALLALVKKWDRETLDLSLEDEQTSKIILSYTSYVEKVRNNHLGKTAMFWVSFIDHCHRLFMLLLSVKRHNIQLFHKCNGDIADLFFAYGGQNYAR